MTDEWLFHAISSVISTSCLAVASWANCSVPVWDTNHKSEQFQGSRWSVYQLLPTPHQPAASSQGGESTHMPPTLWLTTTSSRKFCVCSPLACYWELNQRPALLLEPMRFWGKQNPTVSLKRSCLIWSFITHFKWFGNNWGQRGLHP